MASSSPSHGGARTAPRTGPSLRERFDAMRNLPPFLRQIWQTSRWLTLSSIGLRVIRALLPVASLYVGKLIIDEAIHLVGQSPGFDALGQALASGRLNRLLELLPWNWRWRSPRTCSGGWSAMPTRCCRSCSTTPPACS